MNLKKCPECHRIIDVDDLEDADLTSIIGCGLKEDDFESCYGCENKYGSTICQTLRKDGEWTKTTVKEYYEEKSQ